MSSSATVKKTSKMRKAWVIFQGVVGLSVLLYMTWGEGWRDLTYGRYHRKCLEMFRLPSEITEVRICLLDGKYSQETSDQFRLGLWGREHREFGSITITGGPELDEFERLWRTQKTDTGVGGMCHEPVYGFRLYRNGTMVRSTTICWHCSNFGVQIWPGAEVYRAFVSDSPAAMSLLAFCDKRLPYKHDQPKESSKSER